MLALAYTMKFSGMDVTLGLAFVHTGWLYPLFAPFLGWLGVVVTGSDTSANAMFGSLQRVTAERLGLNPVLIVASNSTGGVMGKMIAARASWSPRQPRTKRAAKDESCVSCSSTAWCWPPWSDCSRSCRPMSFRHRSRCPAERLSEKP